MPVAIDDKLVNEMLKNDNTEFLKTFTEDNNTNSYTHLCAQYGAGVLVFPSFVKLQHFLEWKIPAHIPIHHKEHFWIST